MLAAEDACVTVRELDADAAGGVPVWEMDEAEARPLIRRVLAAIDALDRAIPTGRQ